MSYFSYFKVKYLAFISESYKQRLFAYFCNYFLVDYYILLKSTITSSTNSSTLSGITQAPKLL